MSAIPSSELSWRSMFGEFAFPDSTVEFRGQKDAADPADISAGVAICNQHFSGGMISVHVDPRGCDAVPSAQIVLSYDPKNSGMIAAGVIGVDAITARYAIGVFPGFNVTGGWTYFAQSAFAKIDPARPYTLAVEVVGSRFLLSLDKVIVLEHVANQGLIPYQCGLFCRGNCDVRFSDFSIALAKRSAFVVMEFSALFNDVYEHVIKPVVKECGIACVRADEFCGPGVILGDIIRKLQDADVIIAEISPNNANVFYEVGYAHAINKPTILLAERSTKLPFDLSPFRTIFYDNTIAGKRQLEDGIRNHVGAIFGSGN